MTVKSKTLTNHGVKRLRKTIESNSNDVANEFAKLVKSRAQQLAPVRTGHLKKSIRKKKVKPGRFTVRVDAFYGIYVEMGTRNMAPQPYLRPAVTFARKELKKTGGKAVVKRK